MDARAITIWAIVGSVVIGLVVAFGLPMLPGPGQGVVAEVDGEPIGRESFEEFRRQNESFASELEGADPELLRGLIDRQTLEQLVQRMALAQEAAALGLRVSDRELREVVRSDSRFFTNGRFDEELFKSYARSRERDLGGEFTEEMRRDLLIVKLQRSLVSPIRVSRAAAREAVRQSRTRIRLRYAAALEDEFRAGVQVEDAEVAALAEREPERIQALYDERRAEFERPEEVRVRQMLFQGADAAERARKAREQVQGGADFAALARERSDDEATRGAGGDLGFFPRGRLQGSLEEAAFSLQPGQVSEPVETERGVHLLRVEERRDAVSRPLEAVRLDLAREIARSRAARRVARETAEKVAARLGQGDGLEDAARALGLRVQETPPFSASERMVPGLGPLPGLREAAARLDSEHPVSPRVLEGPRGFYLISLLEREEPDAEALEADLLATREQLEARARNESMRLWIASRLRELERDGRIVRYPLYP